MVTLIRHTRRSSTFGTGTEKSGCSLCSSPLFLPLLIMVGAQASLRGRLFDHLSKTRDPRVVGGQVDWDYDPYYGKISTKGWRVDEKPR